jgi:hypothetical protein
MTRTTDRQTEIAEMIKRQAAQALQNYEEAKAKFAEEFATNPRYAIEWHSDKVVRAQTYHQFWAEASAVLAKRGVDEAVQYILERIDREIESFFGSNSTCPWRNALRRVEGEVFSALDRSVIKAMRLDGAV